MRRKPNSVLETIVPSLVRSNMSLASVSSFNLEFVGSHPPPAISVLQRMAAQCTSSNNLPQSKLAVPSIRTEWSGDQTEVDHRVWEAEVVCVCHVETNL